MARSDVLVRMKADTQNYDANIAKARKSLDKFKNDNLSLGGVLNQASKSLMTMAAGFASVSAAVKATTDVFMANEEQLDEWGRVVESAQSLYKGFIDSLNSGDISGYLSRMDSIVSAARAAYDALDELNTFNAFNKINVQKTQTALQEAIVDFRGGTGSKEAVQTAGAAYKKELEERQKLEQNAYNEAVNKLAAQRGISSKDLKAALSGSYGNYKTLKDTQPTGERLVSTFVGPGMTNVSVEKYAVTRQEKLGEALRRLNDDELDALQALGAQAFSTGQQIAQVDRQVQRALGVNRSTTSGKGGGGRTTTATPDVYAEDSIRAQEKLVQELTDKWNRAGAELRDGYKMQLDEATEKLKEMKAAPAELFPDLDVSESAQSVGERFVEGIRMSIAEHAQDVDVTTLTTLMETIVKNGIEGIDVPVEDLLQQIFGEGMNIPDEVWQNLQDQINEQLQAMSIEPIKIDFKTGGVEKLEKTTKAVTQDWKQAASAITSVGSAISQIEDPAAKVVGTIAQAIASVALGAGQAIGQAGNGSAGGPWGWIAFAIAATATMATTIASIKSATKGGFAGGGIVPGNSFSGDNLHTLDYGINSGELILSKAQQNNLAPQLNGTGINNLVLSSKVSGQDLILTINNSQQGRNQGKIRFS